MHPTDTLLSLSHARIARAAAVGPRRGTQPTLASDQQHLAKLQPNPVRISYNLTINAQSNCTAEAIGRIIDRHRTLARADGFLAQRIAEL
jgi:hypothetical protein